MWLTHSHDGAHREIRFHSQPIDPAFKTPYRLSSALDQVASKSYHRGTGAELVFPDRARLRRALKDIAPRPQRVCTSLRTVVRSQPSCRTMARSESPSLSSRMTGIHHSEIIWRPSSGLAVSHIPSLGQLHVPNGRRQAEFACWLAVAAEAARLGYTRIRASLFDIP